MTSLMISGTPWEVYKLKGIPVYVKREDLCCELPGPPYSKMRGLEIFLRKQDRGTPIGVQDAGTHSRSGWGTAYICKALGMECYLVYPVYVREGTLEDHALREYIQNAKDLGANLIPVKAGRATVCYHQGKKIMMERTGGKGVMLPPGLRLPESVEGTAMEVYNYTPDELLCGTWIVAISSGTVMAGVLNGLEAAHQDITFIAYMGNSKNWFKTYDYMCDIAGYTPNDLIHVDEGYAYSDAEEDWSVPFPASVYYEAKAWKWLAGYIQHLEQPIVFWNIGT